MKILIACEFSGAVRDAFIRRGHRAISCDLLPSEKNGPHIRADVSKYLDERWDMVIAHPPCTYLANSGVRWLYRDSDRWDLLDKAAEFFLKCLNANARYVAVENPVMHKHAVERIGRRQDFTVQPYEFGDPFQKRTCFWTRNLPALVPTRVVSERVQESYLMPPSKDRAKLRSKTYPGIAEAMAEQWSVLQECIDV